MNAIGQTTRSGRPRTGQSLLEVMLALAAAAALLAVLFPTFEYLSLYVGTVTTHRFESAATRAPARAAAPTPAPAAPAATAAPAAPPKPAPAKTPVAPKTAPQPAP